MSPGEFRDITIQVIRDDSTYVDSIYIFTRPVNPVSNFMYEVATVMRGNQIYDFGEFFTDLGKGFWNEVKLLPMQMPMVSGTRANLLQTSGMKNGTKGKNL